MNAALAVTLSSQYSMQNNHHLANSLQHADHVNLIQSNRKRSRNFISRNYSNPYREDYNPTPRMNDGLYGYDGPNRHQFGDNKIPIPEIDI